MSNTSAAVVNTASTAPMRWGKFEFRTYFDATRQLTLEQRGAYMDLICAQMMRMSALPDDFRWLSHQLHVSTRKAKSLVEQLIALGKMQRTDDGLSNDRCADEIERYLARVKQGKAAAKVRWNGAGSAPVQRQTNSEPTLNGSRKPDEQPKKVNEINKINGNQHDILRSKKENKKENKKDLRQPAPLESNAAREAPTSVESAGWHWGEIFIPDRFGPDRTAVDDWLDSLESEHGLDVVDNALSEVKAKIRFGETVTHPLKLVGHICRSKKSDGGGVSTARLLELCGEVQLEMQEAVQ